MGRFYVKASAYHTGARGFQAESKLRNTVRLNYGSYLTLDHTTGKLKEFH